MASLETSGGKVIVYLRDVSCRQTLQQWQFEAASIITIGRSPDREIVIPDERISRLHVVLQNRENEWWLTSMGQNGVQVDGQMVDECHLTHGTKFRLGQQGPLLEFCVSGAPVEGLGMTALELHMEDVQPIQFDQDKLNEDLREIVDGEFFQNLLAKASVLRQETADG